MSGTIAALEMLGKNKSVAERASSYLVSIQRNIQRDVLDALTAKKEKMEEEMFELSDFNLDTDLNKGRSRMTSEDCQARFVRLIELDYQLTLVNLELKAKQDSFNKYFTPANS